MKFNTTWVFLIGFLLMAPNFLADAQHNAETTFSDKEKVKIWIDAIKGEKDKAKSLEAKIEALDGVSSAYVCHIRARAKVKYYADKVSIDDITDVIDKAGYTYRMNR